MRDILRNRLIFHFWGWNSSHSYARLLGGLLLFVLFSSGAAGQNVGDYRTIQDGNWSTLTTWERYDGATWQTPTSTEGYPGENNTPSRIDIDHNGNLPNPIGGLYINSGIKAGAVNITANGDFTFIGDSYELNNSASGHTLTINGNYIQPDGIFDFNAHSLGTSIFYLNGNQQNPRVSNEKYALQETNIPHFYKNRVSFYPYKRSLSKSLSNSILTISGKCMRLCYASTWKRYAMVFFISPLIFITILSSLFFRAVQKVWAKYSYQGVCHKLIPTQRFEPSQLFIQQNHPKNYKGGQQWIH